MKRDGMQGYWYRRGVYTGPPSLYAHPGERFWIVGIDQGRTFYITTHVSVTGNQICINVEWVRLLDEWTLTPEEIVH